MMNELIEFAKTLDKTASVETTLKVGDAVTYTNSNGVKFDQKIIGFKGKPEVVEYHVNCLTSGDRVAASYVNDRIVYLDTDCHWSPVAIASLSPR